MVLDLANVKDHPYLKEGGIFWAGKTIAPWVLLGKQLVGLLCIIGWTIVWSLIIFYTLKVFKKLRVSEETELRGNDLVSFVLFDG